MLYDRLGVARAAVACECIAVYTTYKHYVAIIPSCWQCAVAAGVVRSRGGAAEMGAPLTLPKGGTLAGCEGLVMRVCGDGQPYTVTLTTGGCRLCWLAVIVTSSASP